MGGSGGQLGGSGAVAGSGGMPPVGGTGGGLAGGGTGGGALPGAPVVSELTATPSSLTEGQTITFNALVTDPDGADDIVGGTLLDASGSVTYGNFSPQGGGAFTFATSWAAIHAAAPIEFTGQEPRSFRARFIDRAGGAGEGNVTVTLTCAQGAACGGACVDLSADDRNCGACRRACSCANGACGPAFDDCISGQDGFSTCGEYCTSVGKTCVDQGCNGVTSRIYAFSDVCEAEGAFAAGAQFCNTDLAAFGSQSHRCCCGG